MNYPATKRRIKYYRIYAGTAASDQADNIIQLSGVMLCTSGGISVKFKNETAGAIAEKYLSFDKNSKKSLDAKTVNMLIDTFDQVYPEICDFFNNGELRNVVYMADPGYNGIVATKDTHITINPEWLRNNPWDIDCITHELVHVDQNYGATNCPSWIVEGLADYGRAKFGIYNEEAHWSIPKYSENHKYTDGYRVSAAFFIWLEENVDAFLPKDLNYAIKSGKYNSDYFQIKTGKMVDELWKMYANAN